MHILLYTERVSRKMILYFFVCFFWLVFKCRQLETPTILVLTYSLFSSAKERGNLFIIPRVKYIFYSYMCVLNYLHSNAMQYSMRWYFPYKLE